MAIYYTQATYAPSDRTIVRDTALQLAPSDLSRCHFSICPGPDGSGLYLTAFTVGDAATDILVSRRSPAGLASEVTYSTFPVEEVQSLAICSGAEPAASASFGAWVSYSTFDTTGSTWCVGFDGATLTQLFSAVVLDSSAWSSIDNVRTYNSAPGESKVFTSGVKFPGEGDGGGTRVVYRPCKGSNGDLAQPVYLVARGAPVARAFPWRGKAYLAVATTEDTVFVTGTLRHLSETDGVGGWVAPLVGSWSVGELGSFNPHFEYALAPPVLASDDIGETWVFASLSKAGINQTRLDRVTVRAPDNAVLLPPTTAQGLAALPGGLTSFFDGQRLFEAGFLERPQVDSDPYVEEADGAILPGDYLYIALWEHFDAKGNVHHSRACQATLVTIPGPGTGAVTLDFRTDTATRRAWRGDPRSNAARLVVYRTKAGQTSPFYRLVTPTSTTQAFGAAPSSPLENDPSAKVISFFDDQPDDAMDALGYGFYPYDLGGAIQGGVLEGAAPPPTLSLVNCKGRLFGINGDDSRQILYSRFFVAGEAPAFPPAFRIFLSDTEEGAVSLASLDDKLLVFTPSRIYYVYGEGPSDNALSGQFSEPILFSSALGCSEPRSVVTTPLGVFFLSGDGGIHLVSRSLDVARVSGPVEDSLRGLAGETVVTVKSAHLDTSRGWVVWTIQVDESSTRQLVFSYWTQQWVIWDRNDAVPTVGGFWDGKHLLGCQMSGGRGRLAIEWEQFRDRTINALDGTGGVEAFREVTPVVQTPWLRVGALNGFQRVRRVILLGSRGAGASPTDSVQVQLEHDESEVNSQFVSFPMADVLAPYPALRLSVHVARQKCSSVRVTARLFGDTADVGTQLQALTLEVGALQGLAKLSKQNKAVR